MTDTLERREAILRQIRNIVMELETWEPEMLEVLRYTPQAALLREWMAKPSALTTSPRVDEGRALRREGIVAFSADIENPRVLKLHFDQDVTSAHRSLILDAINARRAAIATTPADPRVGKMEADLEAAKKALRQVETDCASTIDNYARNGPSWTGSDGHEYEDASFVQAKMEELAAIARSTLSQIEGSGR